MTSPQNFLSSLFLMMAATSLQAGQVVTGAFDLKLGDRFDTTQAVEVLETDGGEPLYGFRPSSPFSSLTRYFVKVTPKSSQIVEIWAYGDQGEPEACERELTTISRLLEKKYTTLEKKNVFLMGESAVYASAGVSVAVVCPLEFGSAPLYLKYISSEMQIKAEEEAAELRLETDSGAGSL